MPASSAWNLPSDIGGDPPISTLIAGQINKTNVWYQTMAVDARFRVVAMANSPEDFQSKIVSSPEVIFLDASIFPGPGPLQQALTGVNGAVYLILPVSVDDEMIEQFKAILCVKSIYRGDSNLQDWIPRAYNDAQTLRRQAPPVFSAGAKGVGGRNPSGQAVAGLRVTTVWSRSGGAGRTTIATALSQAAARKGLKTLLIGLDAPDVIPLHIGLQPEPNILSWFGNPTDAGLKAGLQKSGDLDVMAGFPDLISESQMGGRLADQKGSVPELATSAAYGGYAAIFLDTPVSGSSTPAAISASNTWILVCRATLSDVWSSVEAFRTVTQQAAGQHRINPGNVLVILNQRVNGQLTADEWHRAADSATRKAGLNIGFPPVAAVIPYIPDLSAAQDAGRPALDASDEFARPIHRVADALFGNVAGQTAKPDSGKVWKLGPIKIKSKAA
jgi:cellulose biosynthesis protein BcsQ